MTLEEWLKGGELWLHADLLNQVADDPLSEYSWFDWGKPNAPRWRVRVLSDGTAITYCVED